MHPWKQQKDAGLFCGSFLRKGEEFACVGLVQTLEKLRGRAREFISEKGGEHTRPASPPPRTLQQAYTQGPMVILGGLQFVVSEVPLYVDGRGQRTRGLEGSAASLSPFTLRPNYIVLPIAHRAFGVRGLGKGSTRPASRVPRSPLSAEFFPLSAERSRSAPARRVAQSC